MDAHVRSASGPSLIEGTSGKIESVDVVEVRGKILTGYLPELLADFIVGMWCSGTQHLISCFASYVYCPDRSSRTELLLHRQRRFML